MRRAIFFSRVIVFFPAFLFRILFDQRDLLNLSESPVYHIAYKLLMMLGERANYKSTLVSAISSPAAYKRMILAITFLLLP